jgi:Holliday junction resolvase
MDDKVALRDELNKPVTELTRKFYGDVLNAMEARAAKAKKTIDEVQAMLSEIAGIVDPGWMFTQRVTKMRAPTSITINELIPVVRKAAIESHIEQLKITEGNVDLNKLRDEIATLKVELALTVQDRDRYHEAVLRSEATTKDLQAKLSDLMKNAADGEIKREDRIIAQTLIDGEFGNAIEVILISKNIERITFAVEAIGSRGEILSPDLGQIFADAFRVTPRGGVVTDLYNELREYSLINLEITDTGRRGSKPSIVTLTALGEALYEKLFNKAPQRIDHISEHKTAAHATLIMQAKELLIHVDYKIVENVEIKQGNLHTFQPDITATKNGQIIYVEVERDATKARQDAVAKLKNFRTFTNGQMYVFAENWRVQQEQVRLVQSDTILQPGDKLYICDMSKTPRNPDTEDKIWSRIVES